MKDPSSSPIDTVHGVLFRVADRADLEMIVALIADDALASPNAGAVTSSHVQGFEEIAESPKDDLVVAELDGKVVGVMQLTYIPGIARGGARRLHIEAVRVEHSLRGRGLGRRLLEHAHQCGRERGCTLAQLTSDKRRPDAHRFYEGLGYVATHFGYKKPL